MEESILNKKTEINRTEALKSWLKNKYNLAFLGLFIIAIAIRLYFFLMTKNQPLWWDEAEYMSTAKSFAGIIHFDFTFTLNRFPGFPLLASLFYRIGLNNEVMLRFLLAFIPSILAILLMYFTLKSMYKDKRIALISIALFAVLWENLFYSNRFHTENISLIFELLAIFVLFRVYLQGKDFYFIKTKYAIYWAILLSSLCILFRSGNMVFIPVIILFLILINFYKLPAKLKMPLGIGAVILAIVGFVSMVVLSYSSSFVNQFYRSDLPIYWNAISVFYVFFKSLISMPSIFFYCFLIGIITVIAGIIILPEKLTKISKSMDDNLVKADVFNLFLIIGFLFFFMFMLRPGAFETRWFFAILPGLFAFTAKGIINIAEFIRSFVRIKQISVLIIIVFLCLGAYTQLNHANNIIMGKVESYSPVRDSGLWLKENSNPQDSIVSSSLTQHRYYAERNILDFYVNGSNENESAFDNKIRQYKPRYIILSAFEQAFTPQWAYSWPDRHNSSLNIAQVYFADSSNQQPILVIYEIDYSKYL